MRESAPANASGLDREGRRPAGAAPRRFVYLTDIPLFKVLSDEEAEILSRNCARKKFPAQCLIQIEGQPAELFAVLLAGSARAVLMRNNGDEIALRRMKSGDFVGEVNLAGLKHIPYSVVTAGRCEFLFVRLQIIQDLVQRNGRLAMGLVRHFSEEVVALHQRLRHVLCERSDMRIRNYFQELAVQVGIESPAGCEIPLEVPQREIAGNCGLARETVSRTLKDLARRGVLRKTETGWLLRRGD